MTHHDHVDPAETQGRQGEAPAAAADSAAEVPEPPPTDDQRVDAALAVLPELAERPVADHVAVYEDVHRQLQDALADLDGS